MYYISIIALFFFVGCTQPQPVSNSQTNKSVQKSITTQPEQPDDKGTIIVLLDNNKEKNAIVVHSQTDSVLIDSADNFVTLQDKQKKPTQPKKMDASQKNMLFGESLRALPQKPKKFILYFDLGSFELSEQSVEILHKVVEGIKKREPCEMMLTGYTDSKGSQKRNETLSMKRVEATLSWINEYHLNIKSLHKSYKGEKNLIVPTEDEVVEPLNRRVELYIR
jgi:outer membrane protein OmpA-like peptidoglycan-associated protein